MSPNHLLLLPASPSVEQPALPVLSAAVDLSSEPLLPLQALVGADEGGGAGEAPGVGRVHQRGQQRRGLEKEAEEEENQYMI